jgi:hypothetical protein
MSQTPNNCDTFLQPQPNKYKNVNTVDELNIGILNASKKLFDLGVKYTQDIFVTITTAEATILVEASLKTMEHFINKLEENPRINEIIVKQMPKLVGLFDSSVNIIRYIGYDYITKSYYNYASANKPYIVNGTITQDGIGFKKLLDLATEPNNIIGGNNKTYHALKIVDKLTDEILKLPIERQQTELLNITNQINRKIDEGKTFMGGKLRFKTKKRCRNVRKMIKRTIRKFRNI